MTVEPVSRERVLTGPFLLVGFAHFFHALSFSLFLHLPGFLQRLGANEFSIGVIFGVTAAAAVAFRPIMGRAMDERGRRVVVVAGGALHIVACALYLTVHSLGPWIYVVRVIHGIAEATMFAALFALAADIVPESRRIQGIAWFGVSGMLPNAIGGVLGDVILRRATYATLFTLAVSFAVVGWLCSLPLRDPRPRMAGDVPSRGLLAAAMQRNMLPLWWIGAAFSIALAAHFVFIKTFVAERHVGSVGLFFTAYSLAAVSLRVFFGGLPDRVGPRAVLAPALALFVIGQLVLAGAHSSLAVGVAGVLCGCGHGFTFPILVGIVVTRARDAERGSALALFTALFDLGALIGAPMWGAVAGRFHHGPMFATSAIVMAVCTLTYFAWDREGA